MRNLCAEEIRPGLAVCVTVRPTRSRRKQRTVRGTVREVYPKLFTVHNGKYREGFLLGDISRGSIEVVEV